MASKKILITAGPTREYIDPVRFITNASSGKMGMAIAVEAADAGHDVTLLLGPVADDDPKHANIVTKKFVSVDELAELLTINFPECDVLIMAAAVGDFTIANPCEHKIRRSAGPVTLELKPTADLLATVAATKRHNQLLIGFAVADIDPDSVAREKLLAKKLDYVVVNPPAAMSAACSHAAIISGNGFALDWANRPKAELAKEIIKLI